MYGVYARGVNVGVRESENDNFLYSSSERTHRSLVSCVSVDVEAPHPPDTPTEL